MAEIAGLKLIVPGSLVTSGGATASLKTGTSTVEFAQLQSGKSVVIKNVFSSTFDNYLLVFSKLHGVGTLHARFRSATDAGDSSQYVNQFVRADSTTVDGQRTAAITEGRLINTNSDFNGDNFPIRGGVHVYVYGPNLSQPTVWRSTTIASTTAGNPQIIDFAGTRNSSNQSTDIELILNEPAPREMAGQLTIYGLSQ